MTSVNQYIPQVKRLYYCKRGGNHAEQPLNLVCLDPICRNEPLACSTCFNKYHKYHKTVSLDVFLSDYQASINKTNVRQTQKRIAKEFQNTRKNIQEFKENVIKRLQSYVQSIQEYFIFLQKNLHIRDQISHTLDITLQPKVLFNSTSCSQQLEQSVKFIISHSLFNEENRIVNISSILKHDESRTLALLDKVVNQNAKHQREIQKTLDKLNFAEEFIGKESHRIRQMVEQFNKKKMGIINSQDENNALMTDPKMFIRKQELQQTLNFNTRRMFEQNVLQKRHTGIFTLQSPSNTSYTHQQPLFQFHSEQKHPMLSIIDQKEKSSIIRSNITAWTPQYALICPSLDMPPFKEQNWSIKIKNCRNFASKNTLAIGVCTQEEIHRNNFEEVSQNDINNRYMVTSQGYILKNGRQQKSDFTFSAGETVHLKYDPYYHLLIVYKDNGRKLTLKTDPKNGDKKLYACVRLTYASDQVQILNHIPERK